MAVLHPFPSFRPQWDICMRSLTFLYLFLYIFPFVLWSCRDPCHFADGKLLSITKAKRVKRKFQAMCVWFVFMTHLIYRVCVCVCCLNTFFLLNACMRWQFFVKEQFVMFSSSALCEVNCKCGKNKPRAYPQMNPPSSQVAFLLSFHPYTGGTVCSETKQCSSRTTMLHKTTH